MCLRRVFYLDISWGIPPKRQVPLPSQQLLLFPAVKTITFDFPTVNLVSYIKTSFSITNALKIEWDKNFSFFFCDPQLEEAPEC